MQVDIALQNAKVYNIERADVVKGESFTLYTDYDNGVWYSNNDPVLSMRPSGRDAEVTTGEKGLSTILIMDAEYNIQKKIFINVVDEISPMASDLGVSAGASEPK